MTGSPEDGDLSICGCRQGQRAEDLAAAGNGVRLQVKSRETWILRHMLCGAAIASHNGPWYENTVFRESQSDDPIRPTQKAYSLHTLFLYPPRGPGVMACGRAAQSMPHVKRSTGTRWRPRDACSGVLQCFVPVSREPHTPSHLGPWHL